MKAPRSSGAIAQANRNMPANSNPPTSKVRRLADPGTMGEDQALIRGAAGTAAGRVATGDTFLKLRQMPLFPCEPVLEQPRLPQQTTLQQTLRSKARRPLTPQALPPGLVCWKFQREIDSVRKTLCRYQRSQFQLRMQRRERARYLILSLACSQQLACQE